MVLLHVSIAISALKESPLLREAKSSQARLHRTAKNIGARQSTVNIMILMLLATFSTL